MVKNNDQIICPVCGKVGIKDFHQEDVVCPCCGTDLSIYRMLRDVNNASQPIVPSGAKIWKITTAALAAVVLTGASYLMLCEKPSKKTDSSELSILRDSINTLKKEIELTKQNVHTSHVQSAETGDTLYVVRKNDSPCKISRKLFGTESRYKEIEEAMKKPLLKPGDTLILKK
ncbi:hypothetical protein [Segatella copri]|jgi:ribosomal protein L37E|uniref:LysM domain-containing protein n=1 Tax=Segatella copri TaxID=165179 RepID=A0AAW5V1C4_9BACT|nr:hypothetical protein [Segatella copri]MCW4140556.1 hypothetical protein [Segatella copri]MCW4146615.1 hypothetical protein [Segatella copri]MCW4165141.1 hypothetical protein [Segatella copri]